MGQKGTMNVEEIIKLSVNCFIKVLKITNWQKDDTLCTSGVLMFFFLYIRVTVSDTNFLF